MEILKAIYQSESFLPVLTIIAIIAVPYLNHRFSVSRIQKENKQDAEEKLIQKKLDAEEKLIEYLFKIREIRYSMSSISLAGPVIGGCKKNNLLTDEEIVRFNKRNELSNLLYYDEIRINSLIEKNKINLIKKFNDLMYFCEMWDYNGANYINDHPKFRKYLSVIFSDVDQVLKNIIENDRYTGKPIIVHYNILVNKCVDEIKNKIRM